MAKEKIYHKIKNYKQTFQPDQSFVILANYTTEVVI